MEKLYCGGKFHFDCMEEDYLENASKDYRAALLGDVNKLLRGSGSIRISDDISYIGPYYFETGNMIDSDIVRKEMQMIENCTCALFLLEDSSCPGTVSELIYAAALQKKICVVYVKDENETESSLRSPCWYPIIQSRLINKNSVTVIQCPDLEQAKKKILEMAAFHIFQESS